MRHLTRIVVAAIVGLVVVFGVVPATSGAAYASDNGDWAVTPTPPTNPGPTPRQYFFLEGPAGQTVTDSVRVANQTDASILFNIHGADAYNTARDGGFALRTVGDPQTDLGAWVKLSATEVLVPARTQADIPFSIVIPANATPGDHVGGIVATEAIGTEEVRDGVNVTVRRAVAARVYLRVAGPVVPGLAVKELTASHRMPWLPLSTTGDASYQLVNTGNVHLVPTLTVTTTGLFGHSVAQATAPPQLDLVPGANSAFGTELSGIWPFDLVTVTVRAEADGGIVAEESTTVISFSWTGLAVLLLIIAVIVFSVRRNRRGRQRKPRAAQEAPDLAPVG